MPPLKNILWPFLPAPRSLVTDMLPALASARRAGENLSYLDALVVDTKARVWDSISSGPCG